MGKTMELWRKQDRNQAGWRFPQEMGNSRCHFEKDLQRSWIVPRHKQVTGKQPQSERLQTQVLTHESKCFQAQLHCRYLLQQVWACARCLKLVALPSVLETTFGTSDEDTTFYGLHHTEGGSTGTAQPSSPVNYPRQGWQWCTQWSASPPRSNLCV